MCVEWKDNKSVICKSGDWLLARRSPETTPSGAFTLTVAKAKVFFKKF